jgi:hypothetical protein
MPGLLGYRAARSAPTRVLDSIVSAHRGVGEGVTSAALSPGAVRSCIGADFVLLPKSPSPSPPLSSEIQFG